MTAAAATTAARIHRASRTAGSRHMSQSTAKAASSAIDITVHNRPSPSSRSNHLMRPFNRDRIATICGGNESVAHGSGSPGATTVAEPMRSPDALKIRCYTADSKSRAFVSGGPFVYPVAVCSQAGTNTRNRRKETRLCGFPIGRRAPERWSRSVGNVTHLQ